MKLTERQPRLLSTSARKVAMSLTLATILGALSVSPALAERNHDRDDRRGDHGQREWRGDHDREWRGGHHREWRGQRYGHWSRSDYRPPYIYAQPIYVQPPVYYAPRHAPGFSLYFPLDFSR